MFKTFSEFSKTNFKKIGVIFLNKTAFIGFIIILTITLMGILAPLIACDPYEADIGERLQPPSLKHPFGTDQLGRDIFARIAYGAKTTLLLALTISLLSMIIGSIIGAISGYYGGKIDDLLGRIIDTFLAIPEFVLNIALVGVLSAAYSDSILNIVVAIVLTNWVTYARVTRSIVMSIKEREFILCTKALGAGDSWILFKHIIPNAISPIIVLATLNMGSVVMTVASLGFLGLGIQPPTPEWGQMLNSGKNYITTAPWIMFFPGFFIAISILGFNMLGEGLRDVLEKRNIKY